MPLKHISILGSTGSIGSQILKICKEFPDKFSVLGLAAGKNIKLLKEQIEAFDPRLVSVAGKNLAKDLKNSLTTHRPEIMWGIEGTIGIATISEVDTVVSSMVGAAGLVPTYEAVRTGENIALANKETLVMAGGLIMKLLKEKKKKKHTLFS